MGWRTNRYFAVVSFCTETHHGRDHDGDEKLFNGTQQLSWSQTYLLWRLTLWSSDLSPFESFLICWNKTLKVVVHMISLLSFYWNKFAVFSRKTRNAVEEHATATMGGDGGIGASVQIYSRLSATAINNVLNQYRKTADTLGKQRIRRKSSQKCATC